MYQEEQARKKSYRLHITNLLFEDGHFARMGPSLGAFFMLTDKTTGVNEKTDSYDVYGGKFSRKTIPELMTGLKKTRMTIWRYLRRLKKEGYINYELDVKGGIKISVARIPGGFEKSFGAHNKNVMGHNKNVMGDNKNVMPSASKNKNQQGIISELQKSPDPNHIKDNIKDNNKGHAVAEISKILKVETEKGREKVQGIIKRKDPEEMIALAKYCQNKLGVKNPAGLFFSMAEEGAEIPVDEYTFNQPRGPCMNKEELKEYHQRLAKRAEAIRKGQIEEAK